MRAPRAICHRPQRPGDRHSSLYASGIYEVQDISLLPERSEHLLGFEIESPTPGSRHDLHVLHLIGWGVGRDSPAVSVEVVHNERLIRTVPVRGPRADVAEKLGFPPETNCVFHALVALIGLGLEARLSLRVVLEDGSRVPVGSVTLRREPVRSDYEPRIQPLIVTTLGRSGSTWLMQMLASHPQVVVFRRFPYESTAAKYWLHALRVLSEPVNFVESAHPDTFDDPWWVGNNPYHDDRVYEQDRLSSWFARSHIESMAASTQRTIDDWYTTLATTQAQPDVSFFAEKHVWPSYLPDLTWELYPRAKEVFLVRDFRDMARSILAFDAQRGFAGFGRPEHISDEEYMRGELRRMVGDLRRGWQARNDRAHLVRYEDLVREPSQTLTSMLEYLELDSSTETASQVLAHGSEEVLTLPGFSYEASEIASHRTVPDANATVGRWQSEGDESFHALAEEVFGEALRDFGYGTNTP
jgi:sulfotransferase family protein